MRHLVEPRTAAVSTSVAAVAVRRAAPTRGRTPEFGFPNRPQSSPGKDES